MHKHEGFVSIDGGDPQARLFYRVLGNRSPAVVVIHGGPGLSQEYLAPDLAHWASELTLIFYDQRGGGRSFLPEDLASLSMEAHVRDLEALRQELGLGRMTLWAHSFGPMIAARYAMQYPEHVERMVLVGPMAPNQGTFFADYDKNLRSRMSEAEAARLAEIEHLWPVADDPKAINREYWRLAMPTRVHDRASLARFRGDFGADSAEAIRYGMTQTLPRIFASLGDWDYRPALASVDVPTLIIHGCQEPIPMATAEEWARALPDARLLRVPECAHFPHIERPDITEPATMAFFRGTWPAAAERLAA